MFFRALCVAGALSFATGTAFSQSDYAIQFGSFGTQGAAHSRLLELENQFTDIEFQIMEVGDAFKVTSVPFDSYAEAWAVDSKKDLEAVESLIINLPDLSSTSLGTETAPIFDVTNLSPTPNTVRGTLSAFRTDTVPEPSTQALNKNVRAMNSDELFSVGFHTRKNSDGVAALERFISNHSTDQRLHTCCLRLARRYMGPNDHAVVNGLLDAVENGGSADEKAQARLLRAYSGLYTKPASESFEEFCALACDTSLSDEIRHDAMNRSAASAHTAKMFSEALRAYKQIEEHGPTQEAKDDAAMRRIGITFELVRNDVGSWDDVRSLCLEFLSEDADLKYKSTVALMYAETYYYEDRFEELISNCDRLVSLYGGFDREVLMANYWKAVALYELKRFDESKEIFQRLSNADQTGIKFFRNENPVEKSELWLTELAKLENDNAAISNELEEIGKSYQLNNNN